MNEQLIQFLQGIDFLPQGNVGINARQWASYFLNEELPESLNQVFNRQSLFEYVANNENTTKNACIAILAWGGMQRNHGQRLFVEIQNWLPVAENIRNGNINNRTNAFIQLKNLRNNGHLPGMGIAFFTKLICFLNPALNGYIMDQWTSKSIILLLNHNDIPSAQRIIKLNKYSHISDVNTENEYNDFCEQIVALSNLLNTTPIQAEEMIFSQGRGRGIWRQYVILNYQHI